MPKRTVKRARRIPQAHIDLNETKYDKFLRLGVARMNRALTSLRLIGNLASTNYKFTEDDINAMRLTLMSAVDETLGKFKVLKAKPATQAFKFETQG